MKFPDYDPQYQIASSIISTLQNAGFKAYLAGGCVRDMVMGTQPSDYDITTSAASADIKSLFKNTVEVGAAFGVLLVIKNGYTFQVSSFRQNAVTPQEDAELRDFTINGMFYDTSTGELFDWVNAKADIEDKTIRAIGNPDARFSDDYLRLIRAVRIASHLRFTIEPGTRTALVRLAHRLLLTSTERIRDEFIRLCESPDAAYGFQLLYETSLLEVLLGSIVDIQEIENYLTVKERVETLLRLIRASQSQDYYLRIASFCFSFLRLNPAPAPLTPGDKDDIIAFLKKFKFTNRDRKSIVAIMENSHVFSRPGRLSRGEQVKLLQSTTISEELEFNRIVNEAFVKSTEGYNHYHSLFSSLSHAEIHPVPVLTGTDLLSLGLKPSKQFSLILSKAEIKQLNGDFSSKEDALQWVKEHYPL
ncbi:MAG: CCA tRNA nucleotidyltransferase [Candidatus Auribacter fodinae]|jgi:poly(A) polymerase|uniref:CCA tRNA nucleotidyltransferase n=1 Tax=Candidatus Auribacter fodinae TaxID=2093366 RepID=A0A3A4QYW4_9BACT|nr:MAG: CCA tRNA nucleotidyltransferase [Candidatus Auribacter fodinae]